MFGGKWKQQVEKLEAECAVHRAVKRALERSTAVVELSLDGVVLDANDNFCTMMGFERGG